VSAVLRPRELSFAGYEGFRFGLAERSAGEEEEARDKLVADRVVVKLDRNGAGRVAIGDLPDLPGPRLLRTEASFLDPNGERSTISASTPLWPAAMVVGIRTDGWVSAGRTTGVTLAVLDTTGKPVAGVPVEVKADARLTVSHRRRLVGGFYAYDHRTESKPLGKVCAGKSDARGLVLCEVELATPGNVVLTAEVRDARGNAARADASVWVTEQGEVWFETEAQDRMDVLPEKPRYEPGETARLQLRMPFRSATVLVSVEREGVIETRVREVRGSNPTVEVPIGAAYGPNVFVSALAVRGRLREVPWYSIFVWGWRSPIEWWHAWREWREKGRPGAMVDLGKPAFRYGLAELRVGVAAHELKVSVTPERETWRVREKASVRVAVRTPDGKPAPAGTEVAFAAVDQALLELQPNRSWNVLEAMYQRRGYHVDTATAQMQVIGRRHYGRKAVAAGGGGGRSPGRELFDTLLLWSPRVPLDAAGEATIVVPINDSLTRFALTAVADAGSAQFGTGTGSLRVVQDLQVLSGLPPVVRSGDAYRAAVTIRNTTSRPMRVSLQARAGPESLAPQSVEVPAGEAREVGWQVRVPEDGGTTPVAWEIAAREEGGSAGDTLRVTQRREPLVPVTVQQATLLQLSGAGATPVAPPAAALPGRGGLAIALQPALGAVPPAVRRYFEAYPLICLEQKVSRAIGLRDRAAWQALTEELPAYLDDDGLARFFPGTHPGSDALTAYVLAVAHESGFALPDALARRMQDGLAAFVEGRIERTFWSPRGDLGVRKLAAIEALSRFGRATPRQIEPVAADPDAWPTGAVIDWLAILARVPAVADRGVKRARAEQVLRARLDASGTRLAFSTEAQDDWWWLMRNADVNGGRLILATLDSPAWRDALPRLVRGHLGRQVRGRWSTTTANVWGTLALEKFAAAFEKAGVSGVTGAAIEGPGGARVEHDWAAAPAGGTLALGWGSATPASPGTLRLAHAGTGSPWATVQSLAAVPVTAVQAAGFAVQRSVVPVEQRDAGRLSRGDIVRVRLEIDARSDMTWVVVSDPVPAGASILGTGLGRDSALATAGEKASGRAWPAFAERRLDLFRAYYEYVPKGRWSVEYTVRLNTEGTFGLPPTRVEAMYAPEMFGELPNAPVAVHP
jgi:hypothetical protein